MYRLRDFIEKEAAPADIAAHNAKKRAAYSAKKAAAVKADPRTGKLSSDAGYGKEDVDTAVRDWRNRQKGYTREEALKVGGEAIDSSMDTIRSAGNDPSKWSTTDKMKEGWNMLSKNVGNWGGKADEYKKAADNLKTGQLRERLSGTPWSSVISKPLSAVKRYTGLGSWGRNEKIKALETKGNVYNTAKNVGWGLAAGIPAIAGLWGMGRMMKPGQQAQQQQQQQQAPQSPFAAKYYRG